MAKKENYEERTEQLLLPLLEEHAFELVDVEYVKEGGSWYLRAYIDKDGGITIDDCELISKALEAKLDAEDVIDGAYVLEISSPGLTRPLKKDKDLARSIGKTVELKLFKAVDGEKEYYGELVEYSAESIVISTDEADRLEVERKNIALIRLAIEF
ncbi:MAG: ribosome maturation factor RimP [Lachnospiraceae bacterium]|nr:ribosome maturation factor RimP [Lachnospiraceae bacterium]MDY5742645.1 ribosome maturation factor RimP [Lachnospiraceae bacterium]